MQGFELNLKIVLKTLGRFKKRLFLCAPLSKESHLEKPQGKDEKVEKRTE